VCLTHSCSGQGFNLLALVLALELAAVQMTGDSISWPDPATSSQ